MHMLQKKEQQQSLLSAITSTMMATSTETYSGCYNVNFIFIYLLFRSASSMENVSEQKKRERD